MPQADELATFWTVFSILISIITVYFMVWFFQDNDDFVAIVQATAECYYFEEVVLIVFRNIVKDFLPTSLLLAVVLANVSKLHFWNNSDV